MNILYCGNEKVFDGILISLISIVKHTAQPLNVYVLTMDLTDIDKKHKPITHNQIKYLETVLKRTNTDSSIQLIDATEIFIEDMKNSANINNFYTPYCMLRLFSDKIKALPDKLLYLDTDTVAMKDISEMFDIDISECEFAGAIDYLGKIFKNIRYINSGVLLLNLTRIRQTKLFEKTRECCKNKKMAFPDQDALNKYAVKKLRIPSKYNSQRTLHKDTVIRHFCKSLRIFPYIHTVNVKPWETDKVKSVLKINYIDDIIYEYQKCKSEYNKIEKV